MASKPSSYLSLIHRYTADMDQFELTSADRIAPNSEKIDWAALSAKYPVLAHLPTAMRQSAVQTCLTKDESVFHQGDRPDNMFYLISGEVRLIRRSRAGTEIILQRTRSGFFAEASLEHGCYHCNAVATEPTELLRFPAHAFRDAISKDVLFRNDWISHLTREVRRLRTQCERLSLNSATERIIHYLESEGISGSVVLKQSKKLGRQNLA